MNPKLFFSLLILSFSLIFNSCSTLFLGQEPAYVRVDGTHFEYNGKPYYFLGANFWYAVYLGASGDLGDRPRLKRELDSLKALGITNLRILGSSAQSFEGRFLNPGIIIKPGEYNQELLNGLDYLLAQMDKRNMHAVIFLTNTWRWSGGMSMLNLWADSNKTADSLMISGNYNNFMNYSASFYRNQIAKEYYYNYIYRLITRKNKYNGMYYYEDPAIMAWQLANEPRPGQGPEGLEWDDEYYRWIDATARYIHSLDHNHLVSTGSEGLAGSLDSAKIYLTAHKSKYVDYLTFHLWPKDWGWYNALKPDSTYPSALKKAIAYINEHIGFARRLDKPIVMEEFGFPRDGGVAGQGTPTTMRNKYFKKILAAVYDSAAGGAPIAGANVWLWAGQGWSKNDNYKWGFGKTLKGVDNFNSVYLSDKSTISILREYEPRMSSLKIFTEDIDVKQITMNKNLIK